MPNDAYTTLFNLGFFHNSIALVLVLKLWKDFYLTKNVKVMEFN